MATVSIVSELVDKIVSVVVANGESGASVDLGAAIEEIIGEVEVDVVVITAVLDVSSNNRCGKSSGELLGDILGEADDVVVAFVKCNRTCLDSGSSSGSGLDRGDVCDVVEVDVDVVVMDVVEGVEVIDGLGVKDVV